MRRSLAVRVLAVVLGVTALSPGLAGAAERPSPLETGSPTSEVVVEPEAAAEAASQALEVADEVLTTGDGPVDPSIALSELSVAYDDLSLTERRRADDLLARPTDKSEDDEPSAKYPAGSVPRRQCEAGVCIHYITTGDDRPAGADSTLVEMTAWVQRSLDEMIAVRRHQQSLGYRLPPADQNKGGTAEFDVYLAEMAGGLYGYCAPESKLSKRRDDFRRTAYCVLDNDFEEFRAGAEDSLAVTAAHEFFHAVQFGYDASEDRWFKEATATWMEERYADRVDDNRQYLRYGQLRRPGAPLDRFSGSAYYGQWIFIERLSRAYGNQVVRQIWDRLASAPVGRDEFSVQGIARVLAGRRTSFPAFYAAFGAGNLAPAATYEEGAAYQPAPIAKSVTLGPARRQLRGWRTALPHLTNQSIELRPAARLKGRWALRVRVDGPRRATGPGAHALVFLRSGKVVRKPIALDRQGRGGVRLAFTPRDVRRVTVTVANASTRYTDCWGGTAFACEGTPLDNGREFLVTARTVR